jgi:ribosomal protein S24E
MEVEFEKTRNELLHRTNVFVKIRSVTTPSKKDLLKKVASILACDESLVVVDKISQEFGSRKATAYVKVYDSLKFLKEIELEHNIRDVLKEEKEKEDALKAERKAKKEEKTKKAESKNVDQTSKEDKTEEVKEETTKEDKTEEVKEETTKEDKTEKVKEEKK